MADGDLIDDFIAADAWLIFQTSDERDECMLNEGLQLWFRFEQIDDLTNGQTAAFELQGTKQQP